MPNVNYGRHALSVAVASAHLPCQQCRVCRQVHLLDCTYTTSHPLTKLYLLHDRLEL